VTSKTRLKPVTTKRLALQPAGIHWVGPEYTIAMHSSMVATKMGISSIMAFMIPAHGISSFPSSFLVRIVPLALSGTTIIVY
jgi:hypothetical protein